ncbi:MAG: DoxX family protein [Planctomycetota bacterium]|nr:DoxX family protein [Planctomycetota bacterium]
MKFLAPFTDQTYALLRIVAGILFTFHGLQKIFGLLAEHESPEAGSLLWIGGILELVCGVAIAIGLRASFAAFIASGMMAVAYFKFHWKFQFDANFFPIVNKGELAVLYCFLFLFIACRGSGPWSVDHPQGQSSPASLGSAVRSGRA